MLSHGITQTATAIQLSIFVSPNDNEVQNISKHYNEFDKHLAGCNCHVIIFAT